MLPEKHKMKEWSFNSSRTRESIKGLILRYIMIDKIREEEIDTPR